LLVFGFSVVHVQNSDIEMCSVLVYCVYYFLANFSHHIVYTICLMHCVYNVEERNFYGDARVPNN